MLLFYTPITTNRICYTVQLLLQSMGIAEWEITNDTTVFAHYKGAKINYSNQAISEEEIWVYPHTLLQQNEIVAQPITCTQWNELPIFFQTAGTIPFDIFAASFYLIARYEEYLPHETDPYGRYNHQNSLAYRNNFLQLPLVNLWLQHFAKALQHKGSVSFANAPVFSFVPTYDIDIAYSYQHQPILKNVYGFFRDFVKGNIDGVIERSKVYTNQQPDPFDIYSWLHQLHQTYHLKPIYFFLLAEKRKGYDKNISPKSVAMQQLVRQHAQQYEVAIHPSWQSGDDDYLLRREIKQLNDFTDATVTQSRQHYIRMQLPFTYQKLLQNGIVHDYSMGYGSVNGFRASFTLPFSWYDLSNEKETALIIHPFCYMDANSYFEQQYTAAQAAPELQQYYNKVQQVNGTCITIFHNHFITQQPQWLLWRNMYAAFLEKNFR